MKKSKFFKWAVGILGFILILCMLLMVPSVSDKVAEIPVLKATGEKIRSVAQTIAGIAIGGIMIMCGIALASIPILAAVLIIGGLGLLAWNLYPLFTNSSMGGKVILKS